MMDGKETHGEDLGEMATRHLDNRKIGKVDLEFEYG
jgi:hypothetical protein